MPTAHATHDDHPDTSGVTKKTPFYEASTFGRRLDNVLGFFLTLLFGVAFTLLFRLLFIIRIEGKERFEAEYRKLTRPMPGQSPQPLIVAWNHRTLLDSYFFVQAFFLPYCFWTWIRTGTNPLPYHAANQKNYFNTAFRRFCARHWHIVPVKAINGNQKDGMVIRRLVRVLKTHVLHIFPQGRRAKFDDEIIVPPPGTGQIVILSRATVLPMWVQGMGNVQDSHIPGHHIYRLRLRLFRRITICVGEPMHFGPEQSDPQAVSQAILDAIVARRPHE
jgi:1-acyl-sn-glycerol-3-phosphate acyltransferase